MFDLEDTLLTETLRGLHRELWSGIVAVSSGDVTKGLFLRRGRFVFAASTVEEDKLGEFLLRTSRISRPQFAAAMEAAKAGKRFGQALVEIGAVSDVDLEDLVAEQLHMIAVAAFRWTSGQVRTENVDEPIPTDIALPLSTERLLLEGARTYPDSRRLEQALGDPYRRVQRAENSRPAFNYRRVSESRAEKAVLAALRAPKKIDDLLTLPNPRPALVRAIYALFVGGLLEEAPETPAVGVRAVARPPAVVPPTPRAGPPPAAAQHPAPRPPAAEAARAPQPPRAAQPAPAAAEGEVESQARALLERGDKERALVLLREDAKRHPKARGSRRLLAVLLAQETGFPSGLERLMLELLEEDPKDVELRYRLALSYKRAGMGARAILQLKLVLGADPGHAAAWRDLAEAEAIESAGAKRRPRP